MSQANQVCESCGSVLADKNSQRNCPGCLFQLGLQMAAFPQSDPSKSLPHISGYDLLLQIGSGATSNVYKAVDLAADRTVAIKILHGGTFRTFEISERFRIETMAIGRLQHSGIVPLFEVGQQSGHSYLVMPYFPEGSLADALKTKVFSAREAARLVIDAAEAVHHAHQHGVLHRDLKPSNLLLDAKGRPHLADFGLAKIAEEETNLTLSNSVLGTPAYMAPEQASGKARSATQAADVYSLGAILFEMLAGRPVFLGDTPLEVVRQVADADAPSPRQFNPDLDRDLEAICLRALQKEPRHRYASADELARDLQRWLNSEPTLARNPSLIERSLKYGDGCLEDRSCYRHR